MLESADILDLSSPQNIIFRAVFVEKRMLKHHLRDVSITCIIARLQGGNVSVRMGGLAVLGLSKILVRKFKYLLEDCNEVVHLTFRGGGNRGKNFRSLSAKGITLDLELESPCIDDEMVDTEEFVIPPETDGKEDVDVQTDIMYAEFDDPGDISYIEQARMSGDVTGVSSVTEATQIHLAEARGKRRRIVVDSELEFDPQVFRERLRNTRDIVSRESSVEIGDGLCSRLVIAPEILDRIRCTFPSFRESIEGVRDETMTEPYMEVDFQDSVGMSSVSEDCFGEDVFDIGRMGARFVFNEVAQGSRAERSRSFLQLLCLLGRGQVSAMQDAPYSDISCEVTVP